MFGRRPFGSASILVAVQMGPVREKVRWHTCRFRGKDRDHGRIHNRIVPVTRATTGDPDTALPLARHDALFRLLVSDPGRAGRLLRDYLPPEVVSRLDPKHPLVHVEGTAIDGEGSRTQSDAIFRPHLRVGGEAIVYTLLEHKSHADPGAPLLFYHGKAGWSVAEGLGAMIATDDPELVFLPGERFILRVLTALPTEDLSRDAALRAGLIALTRRAVELVAMMVEGLAGDETLQKQVFEYILLTYPDADMDALREQLRAARGGEMEGLMGTMAEALIERGKAEGLEQGKAEGLTRIMERRFGPLSRTVRARIAGADPDELDAWFDRVLDADNLEAMFEASSLH